MALRRANKGTTLVELLIAAVVMAVFAASLFSALSANANSTTRAQERAIALTMAKASIESARLQARNGRLTADSTISARTHPRTSAKFSEVVTIEEIKVGSSTDLFKIKSDIAWKSSVGPNDRISLEVWVRDGDD